MISIPKQIAAIIQSAAERACEGLTDPVIVTAEKNKEWEYVSPSAMKFFNMHKKKGSFGYKTCQEMAQAILQNIDPDNEAIDRIDLSQAGQGPPDKAGFFMNIYLKPEFIQAQIRSLYKNETVRL